MAEPRAQEHPKVFISYSWKSEEYKERVHKLAARLRKDGVEAILDIWNLRPGMDKNYWMENSISTSDRVLILCEENYKTKADSRDGGVGIETSVISPDVYNGSDREKFIPVIMENPPSFPRYLIRIMAIDNRNDAGYEKILYAAYGIPVEEGPLIGDTPEPIKRWFSSKNRSYGEAEKLSSVGQTVPRSRSGNGPALGQTPERIMQVLGRGTSQQKTDPKQKLGSRPQKKKPYKVASGVGKIITFGRYPYGKDGEKEDLKWRVLAVERGRALIITDQLIDCVQYNKTRDAVTWETCSLRKWMNETFIVNAFNEDERSSILQVMNWNSDNSVFRRKGGEVTTDKVFALSIDEINEYFNNTKDRMAAATPYAEKRGSYIRDDYKVDGRGTGWWWLRSPGLGSDCASHVSSSGGVNERGYLVFSAGVSVRPALWLNL